MNEQHYSLLQTVIEPQNEARQEDKLQSIYLVYHKASEKRGKMHRLKDRRHWTIYDLIPIAETWYDDTVDKIDIIAGTDFDLFRRDRGPHGGGFIAIRNNIIVESYHKWLKFNFIGEITLLLTSECITSIYWLTDNDTPSKDSSKVAIFSNSKAKNINDNIKNSDGNRTELYNFLKFKKNYRSSLPIKKTLVNEAIERANIPEKMATHLTSALADGDCRFYEGEMNEKLNEIWNAKFEDIIDHRDLSPIELFEEIAASNGAKSTKDSAPMGFSIKISKAHVIQFARIFVSIFNGCYNLGWIPVNWLQVKLLPIPKPASKNGITKFSFSMFSNTETISVSKHLPAIKKEAKQSIYSTLTSLR